MRALIGALLVGACAGLTAAQLPMWRADDALWWDAHLASPTLPRPLLNLGAVSLRRGEPHIAEAWWQQAEQTDRLTELQWKELRRMRCHADMLYGDPGQPLADCSP